jgi:hypothetical protein
MLVKDYPVVVTFIPTARSRLRAHVHPGGMKLCHSYSFTTFLPAGSA